jgi:putative heme-binding domain-containing protein
VVPLLDTDDVDLQQAALAVISRRARWAQGTLGLLREWLTSSRRSAAQERSLTGALLAFCGEASVQNLLAEVLSKPKTPVAARVLLLRVIARCRLDRLPPPWQQALGKALEHSEPAVRREVIAVVKARNFDKLDRPLAALARRASVPADLRIAALDCIAGRLPRLEPETLAFLSRLVMEKTDPVLRMAAARALGAAGLDDRQLIELARRLSQAGPMVAPLLVPAFGRSADVKVGRALIVALQKSPGSAALSADDLARVLKSYPAEVRQLAGPLLRKLGQRQQGQAAYLLEVARELDGLKGDVQRGRQVFFSPKVACYGCHRAVGQGGRIGPDLSRVGAFRSRRDLLESIIYPSSSIVPEFRSYQVTCKDGKVAAGIIIRESSDAVYLRTAQLAEVRIARKDVDEIAPSNVSLMPDGLEKTMTRQELKDLLEFLLGQR